MDDTHDLLTKAYMNYFKYNEKFAKRPSRQSKIQARKWLSEIRKLGRTRRAEIVREYNQHKQKARQQ
jgi:hypothetical protein